MANGLFPLSQEIYHFNGAEPFTIGDACEGVQIFGGIGSGKTSGSGEHLARAYLNAGFGGLVLCAKKDALDDWLGYLEATNRSSHKLILDISGKFVFPFLQYEVERQGEGAGYTENLVRLFSTVYEAISRSKSGGGSDPYWERAMQQLLRNAIDLCLLVKGTVTPDLIQQVIVSAPKSISELDDAKWKEKSLCFQMLLAGYQDENMETWKRKDFMSTMNFWMDEYPNLAPETRASILSTLTTMMDIFLRRPFRQLFSEKPEDPRTIAYPELSHKGAVIIVNLPVKEFGDAGRAAQVVYKYLWQQAAERRDVKANPRPVFLWIDEAQNFVTEYDMQFQATARSTKSCTVLLTQNLPNYYAEMGGEHSKYRVDSLVGNLQTKIWHANSDPETNKHAADTIGQSWQTRQNIGQSVSGNSFSVNTGQSESFDYDVPPQTFTKLRKGGERYDSLVDAVVFQNGRQWQNGKTHLYAQFKQYPKIKQEDL